MTSFRRIERTNKIFPFGQIHAGFSTDGAINLRDKRGGNVNEPHAAKIGRSRETGYIADHASSDRDQGRCRRSAPERMSFRVISSTVAKLSQLRGRQTGWDGAACAGEVPTRAGGPSRRQRPAMKGRIPVISRPLISSDARASAPAAQ